MPTYEYRCPDGHLFEEFFRTISSAQTELKCPVCGKTAARIMSGGSALLFKGSGFYITDYGKDGKKDLRRASGVEAKGEAGTGSSESKGESKTESKSEPKGESKGDSKSESKRESKAESTGGEKKESKGTSKKDE